ncbi:MAG: response regulator [Defluviitaleaceae bacterium]|nr:response regulator [Defluviitaleaceae bacterium]
MVSKFSFNKTITNKVKIVYIIIPSFFIIILLFFSVYIFIRIRDINVMQAATHNSIYSSVNFSSKLQPHFTLMRHIALSNTVARWVANEDNQEYRDTAFREINGFHSSSPNTRLMITVYDSFRAYNHFPRTTLDTFTYWGRLEAYYNPDSLVSDWFFRTRDNREPFYFNIQRDNPVFDDYGNIVAYTLRIWVNHRIYHYGRFVGVATVGFDYNNIFNTIFGNFDSEIIRGFIIDRYGNVLSDSEDPIYTNISGVVARKPIPQLQYNPSLATALSEHLSLVQNSFFNTSMDFLRDNILLENSRYRYASISGIIDTDWSVVILTNHSENIYFTLYILFLIITLLIFVLSIIFSNYFFQKYIMIPLQKMMQSIKRIVIKESKIEVSKIYGIHRKDEIGDIARIVDSICNKLSQTLEETLRLEIIEQSSKSKSKFISHISHEIRTPITQVIGITEIELNKNEVLDSTRSSLIKIHNSGKFLESIVNQLLDIGKIDAGKMQLNPSNYDFYNLISSINTFAYGHNNNIGYNININKDIPRFLHGDKIRIEQILLNLLTNSFKYTLKGSVFINFDYNVIDDNKIMLVITISDTGVGIKKEHLRNLNEYTRFHEKQISNSKGFGLGLSIVYELLKMMDANIEIKSEVNKGTDITIYIPQYAVSYTPIGINLVKKLSHFDYLNDYNDFEINHLNMNNASILVVDDIEANLFVIKGILDFYNLNIEVAYSGKEAIEKINQGKVYDIIFLDNMMPELNGIETLKIIRDNGYTNPIVSFTADVLGTDVNELLKNGFDDILIKPISTKKLNDILLKFIEPNLLNKEDTSILSDADNFLNEKYVSEKLEQEFLKTQKNVYEEIKEAISEKDFKKSHYLIHTLKGQSYLIKENTLAKISEECEAFLKNGQSLTEKQLYILEEELKKVLNNIFEKEEKNDVPNKITNIEKTKILLYEIEKLLKENNADVLNYINKIEYTQQTKELIELVEDFEFVQALEILKKLKEEL